MSSSLSRTGSDCAREALPGGAPQRAREGACAPQNGFRFFSSDPFETVSLLRDLAFSAEAVVLQSAPNTLTLRLEHDGPVKLSSFGALSFGRIAAPESIEGQSFRVASLRDLMAGKLKVLWQRAEAKDYIDVSAIIQAGVPLELRPWLRMRALRRHV